MVVGGISCLTIRNYMHGTSLAGAHACDVVRSMPWEVVRD
jgi:hypothetical protein